MSDLKKLGRPAETPKLGRGNCGSQMMQANVGKSSHAKPPVRDKVSSMQPSAPAPIVRVKKSSQHPVRVSGSPQKSRDAQRPLPYFPKSWAVQFCEGATRHDGECAQHAYR